MDPFIAEQLNQEEPTSFHDSMLRETMSLVDNSRGDMSAYYDQWDKNIDIFKGYRTSDEEDQNARTRKEPEKMIVPISYSQIQTFIAFCMTLFTQREKFFELIPVGADDHRAATIGEAFLQRDLDASKFELKLYQFLLDVCRCSFGVLKNIWVEEKGEVEETIELPPMKFLGLTVRRGRTTTMTQNATTFLGNRILTVSPYRFFPDTRLPLSRFQEGEFCASEDLYSVTQLKQMEKDGLVSGVDHIKALNPDTFVRRLNNTPYADRATSMLKRRSGSSQSKGVALVTEVQRVLIPSQYMVDDKPLGESDMPTKYVLWYANDNRLLKCESMNFAHKEFTYAVGQFNPDDSELMSISFSDTIAMLQDVISWFINSRITSVRKVINNRLIVNPDALEWKDLQDRSPVVRLKPNAAQRDVNKAVMQLKVDDVTQGHLTDVKFLHDLVQVTTGVNDTLLGQFQSGRRTATENRNTSNSAAARLKIVALTLFRSAIEPLGRQMLMNLRQGLNVEQIARVVGPERALEGATFVKATKADLQGSYDFEVFDGTLPSEKGNAAMTLENYLVGLIKAPQAAIALQMDPRKMFMEALELRGIRNPERFTLQQVPPNVIPNPNPSEGTGSNVEPGGEGTVPSPTESVEGQPNFQGGLSGLVAGEQ